MPADRAPRSRELELAAVFAQLTFPPPNTTSRHKRQHRKTLQSNKQANSNPLSPSKQLLRRARPEDPALLLHQHQLGSPCETFICLLCRDVSQCQSIERSLTGLGQSHRVHHVTCQTVVPDAPRYWKKLMHSCPREWDLTCPAQGREGNLPQGRTTNLKFLRTQTHSLTAVLCHHDHWRHFQSHQWEKQ